MYEESIDLAVQPITIAKMSQFAVVDKADSDAVVYEGATPPIFRSRATARRHMFRIIAQRSGR